MNRYVPILEKIIAALPLEDSASRRAVYERAQAAIGSTFSGDDKAAERLEEMRLLEEAVIALERSVAEKLRVRAEEEQLRVQAEEDMRREAEVREAEAREAEAREVKARAAEQRRLEQAARAEAFAEPAFPPPPFPLSTESSHASAALPHAPRSPESAPRAEAAPRPAGALFSAGGPTPARYDQDIDEDEDKGSPRLRIAFVIIVLAAAGGLLLARPDLFYVTKPQLPRTQIDGASQAIPVVRLQQLKWSAQTGENGEIAWTSEQDRSSFAPRRSARSALTGRADLRPLAPPVTIYFIPSGDEGLRASHFLEFRFEDDPKLNVTLVQSVRLVLPGQGPVEPEGVVIRTSPRSFAFVFSNNAKDLPVNDALLAQAEEITLVLWLENGATRTINLQAVKLK